MSHRLLHRLPAGRLFWCLLFGLWTGGCVSSSPPDATAQVGTAIALVQTVTAQAQPTPRTEPALQLTTPAEAEAPQVPSATTAAPDRTSPSPTAVLVTPYSFSPPPPLQAPGLKGVILYSICVHLEASYPQDEQIVLADPAAYLPADDMVTLLNQMGIETPLDPSLCEATLTFTWTGVASSGWYEGGVRCYTGADVTGEVTLESAGRAPLTLPLTWHDSIDSRTASCPSGPFHGSPLRETVYRALRDVLYRLWGMPVFNAISLGGSGYGLLDGEAVFDTLQAWISEGTVAKRDVVPIAMQGMLSESPTTRYMAAWTLQMTGPEAQEAAPLLIAALSDWHENVRMEAACALGYVEPELEDAVPALIAALKDSDPGVRMCAAYSLGWLEPEVEEVVPVLIAALEDPHAYVPPAAAWSLAHLTGQDFGKDAAAWQAWWEAQR